MTETRVGRRPRPRRSRRCDPGYTRTRRGDRLLFLDVDGSPLTDPAALERIRHLAIPPAWRDVWICRDPLGHLQATGVDAAGRTQYRYHDLWRERRDHVKFEHMLEFARTLPPMRLGLVAAMEGGSRLDRARVLACSVRLLDVGMFRIGSEVYAREDGHLGLATIAKSNVELAGDRVVFDYIAKEGVRRVHAVTDPLCVEIVTSLKRRRSGGDQLLAYREGRVWHPVHAHLINEHLKGLIGESFSAKNFRTWNGTALAAVALAAHAPQASTDRARQRAIKSALVQVSEVLGNTPAVARSSYIDPRVFDRYLAGHTIAPELAKIDRLRPPEDARRAEIERAVLDLLADDN